MTVYREAISQVTVPLARRDLARMIRLMRLLSRLSENAAYRELVSPLVPDVARFDPGHHAVMMGYDFHLTPQGPRLIEVNTNAGGALLAYLAHFPEAAIARAGLAERLRHQFLAAFAEEMRRFSGGGRQKPAHIAIIDEDPRNQYLYREMVAFTELFRRWDVPSTIADPSALVAGPEGVFADGERVDLIYNRHCDFYLERPEMAGIRAAYRAGTVCLTPNPFAYGLLADKRRMTLWSDPEVTGRLGLRPAGCRSAAGDRSPRAACWPISTGKRSGAAATAGSSSPSHASAAEGCFSAGRFPAPASIPCRQVRPWPSASFLPRLSIRRTLQ